MLRLRGACGGAVALWLVACGGGPVGEVAGEAERTARVVQEGHVRDPMGEGAGLFGRTLALASDTLAVMEITLYDVQRHAHVYGTARSGWVHEAVIEPPAGGAWSGWSVAAGSGVVAIPGEAPDGAVAVFVFERGADGWTLAQTLPLPGGTATSWSAGSIALRGNRMIVGGSAVDRGAVWCYERTGAGWMLVGELASPWSRPQDGWGSAVALSARGAVILEQDHLRTGLHAVVFDEVNGALVPGALVEEELPFAPSGVRLAVAGAWVALSVPGRAVHVWRADGRGAAEALELEPADPLEGFGHALAIGDGFIAVAAPFAPGPAGMLYAGAVRVFVQTAAGWSGPVALSSTEEVSPEEGFGHAVAAFGDHLAIGVPNAEDEDEPDEDSGAVFVYQVRVPR